MVQIFDNPDVVMTKYVEAVMDRVLQVGWGDRSSCLTATLGVSPSAEAD